MYNTGFFYSSIQFFRYRKKLRDVVVAEHDCRQLRIAFCEADAFFYVGFQSAGALIPVFGVFLYQLHCQVGQNRRNIAFQLDGGYRYTDCVRIHNFQGVLGLEGRYSRQHLV